DPAHAVGIVLDAFDVLGIDRAGEARPARAAFELGLLIEERQPAQPAAIDPVLFLIEEPAAERGFGAVMQQHLGLLARERAFEPFALMGVGGREIKTER